MSKHGLAADEGVFIDRRSKKLKVNGKKGPEENAEHAATDRLVSGTEDEIERKRRRKEKKEKRRQEKEGEKRKKGKQEQKEKKMQRLESESELLDVTTTGITTPSILPANGHANGGTANGSAKTSADGRKKSGKNGRSAPTSSTPTDPAAAAAFFREHNIRVTDPLAGGNSASASELQQPVLQFSQLPALDPTSPSRASPSPFATFDAPTPIQSAAWPYALAGRDVVGVAETGSGKTLAFGVPLVRGVLGLGQSAKAEGKKDSRHKRVAENVVRAVVLSPTRELAMQTHASLSALAAPLGLRCVCIYGGSPKHEQLAALQKQPAGDMVVVATPGRLRDFLDGGDVSLARASFAVLDEADRMLDKGFEDEVRFILSKCPPSSRPASEKKDGADAGRQTLMFTATWPPSVRDLAATFMVDPVRVTIGKSGGPEAANGDGADGDGMGGDNGVEGQLQANVRIEQRVEVVDPRGKEQRLLSILREHTAGSKKNDRVLVFCLYKKEATRVEGFLRARGGFKVASIHGDLRQEQRTRSLDAFRSGASNVLVATDVAARGLDIPEVKLVLNVTFPLTIEDYVHRIGRTGRAGKTGLAITLFTEHDKSHSGELVNILKGAGQPVPEDLLKFGTTVKKKKHDVYGDFFKDVDMSKTSKKITFD